METAIQLVQLAANFAILAALVAIHRDMKRRDRD